MVHTTFDLAHYTALCPLEKLRREAANELLKPSGEMIEDPRTMAIVEQLRAEALQDTQQPESRITDVFVPFPGEPPNRAGTKVGGLPYWPEHVPLPSKGNRPLTFVAQLCFADSRDITPNVPNDLLLIFGDEEALSDDPDDASALQFYWTDITDKPLVPSAAPPRSFWEIPAQYGVRHRTVDYVTDVPQFRQDRRWWLLSQIEATKIGGIPRWIQHDPGLPGSFLASVNAIEWDDCGVLYLNMSSDGKIHWTIQGY